MPAKLTKQKTAEEDHSVLADCDERQYCYILLVALLFSGEENRPMTDLLFCHLYTVFLDLFTIIRCFRFLRECMYPDVFCCVALLISACI